MERAVKSASAKIQLMWMHFHTGQKGYTQMRKRNEGNVLYLMKSHAMHLIENL